MSNDSEPILWTDDLVKHFESSSGFVDSLLGRSQRVEAVDGIDLTLYPGETLGVVGESGCGKTTLGRTIVRLLEPTAGSVYYQPQTNAADDSADPIDLTTVSNSRLRDLRTDLQYVFQDPFSSLNPRLTVGDIVGEPLDIHDIATGSERTERIHELLEIVGLNPSHAHRYPHEFSGGQRQRIGIARALAVDPEVIVCDEPVSALDVSVQAQILNLLADLQAEFDLSYVFIAHDLSVVEHISDRIAVMYLGEFAEVGTTREVFSEPYHPYTEALLSAIPEPDPHWDGDRILLEGQVPSPIDPPTGCRFHTRCPRVIPPAEFDLERSTWRSILDYKLRVDDADSITGLFTRSDDDAPAAADLPVETVDELIREEFDIPPDLPDPDAEAVFSRSIQALATTGVDGAGESLEDVLVSPCETTRPPTATMTDTHEISCLLYDGAPLEGRSETSDDLVAND